MKDEWKIFENSTWFGMVKAIAVDTSKSENELISADFGVEMLPTIVKVTNDMRKSYNGDRTSVAILNWVQ